MFIISSSRDIIHKSFQTKEEKVCYVRDRVNDMLLQRTDALRDWISGNRKEDGNRSMYSLLHNTCGKHEMRAKRPENCQ